MYQDLTSVANDRIGQPDSQFNSLKSRLWQNRVTTNNNPNTNQINTLMNCPKNQDDLPIINHNYILTQGVDSTSRISSVEVEKNERKPRKSRQLTSNDIAMNIYQREYNDSMQRIARIDDSQRQASALSSQINSVHPQRRVSKLRLRLNLNTRSDEEDERPRKHSQTKKSNIKNLLHTFISERMKKSKKNQSHNLVKFSTREDQTLGTCSSVGLLSNS